MLAVSGPGARSSARQKLCAHPSCFSSASSRLQLGGSCFGSGDSFAWGRLHSLMGSSTGRAGRGEHKRWRLLSANAKCIHFCMPNVLTVRLPSSLLAKVDRKAAALGRARAEHVRQVLEADVAAGAPRPKRFACLSLKGRYALGRGSDNAAVRRALTRPGYEEDR